MKHLIIDEYQSHNEMLIEQVKEKNAEIKRLRAKMETVAEEISYARTTGNDKARQVYLLNAERFIEEALKGGGE